MIGAAVEPIANAAFFARGLAANGTTCVVFTGAVSRRTAIEPGTLGVERVPGDGETAVAEMANGYARTAAASIPPAAGMKNPAIPWGWRGFPCSPIGTDQTE